MERNSGRQAALGKPAGQAESWSRPAFLVADLSSVSASLAAARENAARDFAADAGRQIPKSLFIGAKFLFDLAIFLLSGFFAYRSVVGPLGMDWSFLAAGLAIATLAGLVILRARWSYTIRAMGDFPRQTWALFLAYAGGLALWTCACVLADAVEPYVLRNWVLLWFGWGWGYGALGGGLFALLAARWSRQGLLARRTVVVGPGADQLETLRRLEQSGQGALKILGVFDDRAGERVAPYLGGYPLLGTYDGLEAFCRDREVDLLVVAVPPSAEDRLLHILSRLWVLPVDVRVLAQGKLTLRNRAYNYIGDVPFLPVFDRPLSDWDLAVKSIFDRVVAALLIVLFSPLLAALALGVKLSSPGPVFFVQTRDGYNNSKFGVLKFRSMYHDSCDHSGQKAVSRGDPRVTPFGAFLRRSSLDELPQLFNVLRGDLSLVGPRPHAAQVKAAGRAYEEAVEGYFARHRVKPGMTGWAQVHGWRGETDTVEKIEQRVAHDLFYIENWSLWLDVKILLMTPIAVLFGKNAY
jgi:Undecaprenyl-phosphate glucose phosphotransferase